MSKYIISGWPLFDDRGSSGVVKISDIRCHVYSTGNFLKRFLKWADMILSSGRFILFVMRKKKSQWFLVKLQKKREFYFSKIVLPTSFAPFLYCFPIQNKSESIANSSVILQHCRFRFEKKRYYIWNLNS